MSSLPSQFDQDTRLLDALDRARLDTPLAPAQPSTLTARLRELCSIHGLPADDGLLARATALFLTQPTSAASVEVRAQSSDASLKTVWSRPDSREAWEAARQQVAKAAACISDPEPKWTMAMIFYLPIAFTGPLMASKIVPLPHIWPWVSLALVAMAPLFITRVRRRIDRSVQAALAQIKPWLTNQDMDQGKHRQASGAQVNLMSATDRATVENLRRWALSPANHALLVSLADSEVPLLMGDVRTLEATLGELPSETPANKAAAWQEHLQRFARQVHAQTAGALSWQRYDRVDKLSGRITKIARAQSTPFELERPYEGAQRLVLTAIQEPADDGGTLCGLWLTLPLGQLGLSMRAVRVRVDDQPVEVWPGRDMSGPGNSRDSVWLFQHPERCLERLRGAQRMHVELPVYSNPSVVEVFEVGHLDWEAPGEDLALAALTDANLRRQLASPSRRLA